jgi:3-deoxy-D-manno-octulosonate 8-phosphate phosphatase (KDO 8-P phosphatase)
MVIELDPGEARRRARRMRMLLTDVDGVLTDSGVYCGEAGELALRFSRRDGMGVERLRAARIETVFVSRERSPIVERRAQKLGIERTFLGCRDKLEALRTLVATGITPAELGYIGDDVNDLEIVHLVREVGLTAAPSDAMPEVRRAVHRICPARGGEGAFRDFAEWILSLRREEKTI